MLGEPKIYYIILPIGKYIYYYFKPKAMTYRNEKGEKKNYNDTMITYSINLGNIIFKIVCSLVRKT